MPSSGIRLPLCKEFISRELFGFICILIKKMIMKKTINWLLNPPVDGQPAILLIRLMTGGVFFWEGILKFVYPNQGVRRFTKLGFPTPQFTPHFVAVTEISGCLFLLFVLLPRLLPLYF